jgi:hypothetical protein
MNIKEIFTEDNLFKNYIPEKMKQPIISGHEYKKLCKWNICPRYEIVFDPTELQDDDLIFMNGDYIEPTNDTRTYTKFFREHFTEIKPRAVIHNSDFHFTKNHYQSIKDYFSKIYTINSLEEFDRVKIIPLGFNDTSSGIIDNEDWDFHTQDGHWEYEKDKLCLVKFWRSFMREGRSECYNIFLQRNDFCDVKNENDWQPTKYFYDELKRYKYCVSPRGVGMDTHRFWECLMFNVVPIVLRDSITHFYKNFPCLIVDRWQDVTKELLEKNWDSYYFRLLEWKAENPDWYLAKNWIK